MNNHLKKNKLFIIWFFVYLISTFVLINSHFKSESNDSKYYTELVIRYQNKNWRDVLTPKWGENYWGFDPQSYMQDQFPGQIIMGVALTKLAIPASQSLHLLGMSFQILSIVLLSVITKELQISEGQDNNVLLYSLLLIPLSYSYNIRANHELGIMFFSLSALFSGLRISFSKWWSLLSAFSSLALLWIKGPFFIFGIVFLFIGFYFSNSVIKKYQNLLLAILISFLMLFVSAYIFEVFYQKMTNESFLSAFWHIQMQQRALVKSVTHTFIVQKFLNFNYYFSHYLAYSLPWSLIVVVNLAIKRKNFNLDFIKSRLSLCLLFSAMAYCLTFSLSDRVASRYVFPGYYLIAAWFILVSYHSSEIFNKTHRHIMKNGFNYLVPALWFIAFIIHFI